MSEEGLPIDRLKERIKRKESPKLPKDDRKGADKTYTTDKKLQPVWDELLGKDVIPIKREDYDKEKIPKIDYVKVPTPKQCQDCVRLGLGEGYLPCEHTDRRSGMELW